MGDFIYLFVIAASLIVGYVLSLFAASVYLGGDDVLGEVPHLAGIRREYLIKLARDPRALSQIATVFTSFSLILCTVMAVLFLRSIAARMQMASGWLIPAGLILLWLLHLVVVEYLPRRAARQADGVAVGRYLWLVTSIYVLFLPVISVYRRAIKGIPTEPELYEEQKEEIIERAIETLADQAGIGDSLVQEEEKKMIGQIFQLDQTVVREIMTPRIDIVGIDKNLSFRDTRALVQEDGHSRFPVFDGTIDRVIGILYVKDMFAKMPEPGERFDMVNYLRRAYFVPESMVIGELLREFKIRKLHMAIVVDEFGGVSGLVTLEDVLEEIVGEIQDEHDAEEADFLPLPDGWYLVDGAYLLEELQDQLGTDYEPGNYDTVSGLIFDLVGSVPRQGARVTWNDLEMVVEKVDGQRIKKIRVTRRADSPHTAGPTASS